MSLLLIADIGDNVVVRGTLTDEDGAAVTNATVSARVLSPSGTETDLGTASHEGQGVYAVTVEPDESGIWTVRFESADPTPASVEGSFYVNETRFS